MTETLDKKVFKKPTKALVKEFFDLDAVLHRHLLARLPFISSAQMRITQVYKSKDQLTQRFRANWFEAISGVVKLSQYVQIVVDAEGKVISYNAQ